MLLDVLEEMTIGISPVDSFKVIQE
jgi:hypothetical protein